MWPSSIAVWNWSAPPHFGHVSPSFGCAEVGEPRLVVAPVLDPAEVPAGAVRAGDELAVAQRLVGDHLAVEAHRAERAGVGAERRADLVLGRRPVVRCRAPPGASPPRAGRRRGSAPSTSVPSLLHDRHRLRRRRRVDPEELRRATRSSSRPASRSPRARRAAAGTRAAAGSPRATSWSAAKSPFSHVTSMFSPAPGGREEVERLAAAHHPGLGLDLVHLDAAALEDPVVRAAMQLERALEPGGVAVERVGVLHDELAQADQPAARPRLVTLLRSAKWYSICGSCL